MPIFEYECPVHGKFERIRVNSVVDLVDVEKVRCMECNRVSHRITSVPAQPQFKGSGFYSTDYKGKK